MGQGLKDFLQAATHGGSIVLTNSSLKRFAARAVGLDYGEVRGGWFFINDGGRAALVEDGVPRIGHLTKAAQAMRDAAHA